MNIKRIVFTALVAVFSTLLTLAVYNKYSHNADRYTSFQNKQASAFGLARLTGTDFAPGAMTDFTYAAAMTTPAVVHIKTTYMPKQSNSRNYDPFGDFFGGQFFFNYPDPYHSQPQESSGSGVIISDDGYIVTNNHVVDNGDKVQVVLFDKRSFDATVVGTDPSTDLALLKIDETKLPFIVFGNSDSVKVGQWALAVGNPFNLESTVTAGIISAKGRNINILKGNGAIESYIQTDAAVNPGNSGGALVNTKGELIGINSAIATPTGSYAGYSFAVPVNIVSKVVNDLMKFGKVERGYLGITLADINADLAKEKNITITNGVYVDSVLGGSAAKEAGLKAGDIITNINGMDVNTIPELQEQVAKYHPGDKIDVTVNRKGKDSKISIVLKSKAGDIALNNSDNTSTFSMLGAQFGEVSAKEKKDLGISGGAKVLRLADGKLSRNTDIREGFIITRVDNKPINSVNDLKAALQNKKGGVMIEGTYPDTGGQYFYAFGM